MGGEGGLGESRNRNKDGDPRGICREQRAPARINTFEGKRLKAEEKSRPPSHTLCKTQLAMEIEQKKEKNIKKMAARQEKRIIRMKNKMSESTLELICLSRMDFQDPGSNE